MLWLILRRQLNDAKVLEEYNKSDNNNKKCFCGKLYGRYTSFHEYVWLGGGKQLEKLQERFFS